MLGSAFWRAPLQQKTKKFEKYLNAVKCLFENASAAEAI
jgi:hypothetical protein